MLRDRMPDLLRLARDHPDIYNEPEHHEEVPIPSVLEQVLIRAEKILKFLKLMKTLIEDLKLQHQGVFTCASILNANQLRNKISVTSNRFTAFARKTEAIIRRIELSDEEKLEYKALNRQRLSSLKGTGIIIKWKQTEPLVQVTWPHAPSTPVYIPAEIRIQMLLHNIFSYRLTELVYDFYTEQKNYNVISERKIKRQLSILGKEMDKEDIHRVLNENLPLLHCEIMDDRQVSKEVRAQLNEVAHFEKEILQLERNITQLHKAFGVMMTLVQDQGVAVDRIEHHVTTAGDYVASSTQQLKKAGKLQDKYRKKKGIFIVMVIIVLLVVGGIIASKFSHGSGSVDTSTQRSV